MKHLPAFPDNYFQLAIVDPPFGIGATWSKSRRDRFFKQGKLHSYQNDKIPTKEYFQQLKRVSKNQIIWGGNYFTKFLRPTNSWIIWDKIRNADLTFMSEGELAWTSFQKVTRIVKFEWNGVHKCEIIDKIHPHQKPVKLYRWQLKNYATPGDLILDTHAGSGSCQVACVLEGFNYVSYEIDKEYFAGASKRIEAERLKLKLL